jgi:hypothetical protein
MYLMILPFPIFNIPASNWCCCKLHPEACSQLYQGADNPKSINLNVVCIRALHTGCSGSVLHSRNNCRCYRLCIPQPYIFNSTGNVQNAQVTCCLQGQKAANQSHMHDTPSRSCHLLFQDPSIPGGPHPQDWAPQQRCWARLCISKLLQLDIGSIPIQGCSAKV